MRLDGCVIELELTPLGLWTTNTHKRTLQSWSCIGRVIRELEKSSRGRRRQRRQNNKTNYTRQKAHVNMWNKADIRAVLLSCETSLLYFHVVCKTWSIFQQLSSIFSFRKRRWRQLNFSENRNKQCNQSKYMLRKTQGLCRNIFTACRRRRPRLFFLFLPEQNQHVVQ